MERVVFVLLVLLLVTAPRETPAADRPQVTAVQARVVDGWLAVDVHCGQLFTPRSLSTLHSGLPAVIRVDVQLQQEAARNTLFGGRSSFELVHEVQWVRSLTYDVWDERYVLRTRDGVQIFDEAEAARVATQSFGALRLLAVGEVPAGPRLRLRARAELVAVAPEHGETVAAWLRDAGDPLSNRRRGGTLELGMHDLLELLWDRRTPGSEQSAWTQSAVFRLAAGGTVVQ